MLSYGLPSAISTVPALLNLRLDQMLMAAFLKPDLLGLYVIAVAWSGAALPVLSAMGSVLFPHIASRQAGPVRNLMLAQGLRIGSLLSAVLTLGVLVMTPIAIPVIFGSAFRGSIPAALILVPAGGILAMNATMAEALRGLGNSKAPLRSEVAGLLVTVIALAALLSPLNIVGAALASLFGYAATAASLLSSLCNVTELSRRTVLVPSRDDVRFLTARVREVLSRSQTAIVGQC